MMRLSKIFTSVVVVLCSMGLVGYSQARIDALHEEALDDELLYIPSETLLTHFTAGMSNVVADLLWIETIQYTVKEFHDPQRKFKWLEHMCNAVTDLDPYFKGAYVNGGMFLSSIGADDKALKLLKKGFVRNPDSWEIPYEIVKVYVLNRRDDPRSPEITTHYLRMLAERHEHPEMYLTWARRIQEQNDLKDAGRAIWEDVLKNSKDKFIRELAAHNLRVLTVRDTVDALNELVAEFAAQTGRNPVRLEELVAVGLLAELPQADEYGAYSLDEAGTVQHTLLLREREEGMLVALNALGAEAAQGKDRNPRDLVEWAEWVGEDLPEHPVPGETWHYDPETGRID